MNNLNAINQTDAMAVDGYIKHHDFEYFGDETPNSFSYVFPVVKYHNFDVRFYVMHQYYDPNPHAEIDSSIYDGYAADWQIDPGKYYVLRVVTTATNLKITETSFLFENKPLVQHAYTNPELSPEFEDSEGDDLWKDVIHDFSRFDTDTETLEAALQQAQVLYQRQLNGFLEVNPSEKPHTRSYQSVEKLIQGENYVVL